MKKIKALNGEEANAAITRGGEESTGTKTKGAGNDIDSSSSSSESSSEDTKDDRTPGGNGAASTPANAKKTQKHSQNDEGEISSVTTR